MNKQEIETKINIMEKELADLKQELNKTEDEWIPNENEEYWYYDKNDYTINCTTWINGIWDNRRQINKVIFKTLEEARRYADYQKAKKEYSYEFSRKEWEDDNTPKRCIYFNYNNNQLDIGSDWGCKYLNKIYFKTEDQAQEFIDKYKDEILEFEFGIKGDK